MASKVVPGVQLRGLVRLGMGIGPRGKGTWVSGLVGGRGKLACRKGQCCQIRKFFCQVFSRFWAFQVTESWRQSYTITAESSGLNSSVKFLYAKAAHTGT